VEALHRRRLQPVAVAQPLGDEVRDVGPEQFQRAPQDDRRGDAVHVVVAVDRDALAPSRSLGQDPLDGGRHVGEQERIVQIGERRRRNRRAASGSPSPRMASSCAVSGEIPSSRAMFAACAREVSNGSGLPEPIDHSCLPQADVPHAAARHLR
jgi:hypothetical protein